MDRVKVTNSFDLLSLPELFFIHKGSSKLDWLSVILFLKWRRERCKVQNRIAVDSQIGSFQVLSIKVVLSKSITLFLYILIFKFDQVSKEEKFFDLCFCLWFPNYVFLEWKVKVDGWMRWCVEWVEEKVKFLLLGRETRDQAQKWKDSNQK